MVLPFGKYRGATLDEVPIEYVIWLASVRRLRASHRELYLEACRRAISYLKATVIDLEPSPRHAEGEPLRVQSAAEFCQGVTP